MQISGSPALLMIQGRKPEQQSSFSREFPTAWALRGTGFIKSAGEPDFTIAKLVAGLLSLRPDLVYSLCHCIGASVYGLGLM
jgi:hypothetical protein